MAARQAYQIITSTMASINTETIQLLAKRFMALPVALLLSPVLHAQEPDTAMLSKAATKYASENAVYTNYQQKLILKYEDGELSASTKIKKERLLIGNLSPAQHNYDYVYDNYFDQLTDIDAIAYVPQKNGGFKQRHDFVLGASAAGDNISDAKAMVTEFTGLTKGSFIRLNAIQEHRDLIALPIFFAQENYPIIHEDFEIVVPDYVDIKFVIKGENTGMIHQSKEVKNGNIVYHFTADNVPAYKSFGHVPSALYYVPHVLCYVSSYRLPGQTKDSVLLSDAAHLYKASYKYINSLNLKQDSAIKKLVDKLTKGDATDRQKAMHIYDWVQKNIHYIGFEIGLGGMVPREADTVFKKKYGDCKDMSSLLIQMGRMAGLETYFTWIGTTERPYEYAECPLLSNSNHMICALKLGNEWMFMDGTHSELPFGANRHDIQGQEAMIAIDKNTYKIMNIPVVPADKNVTTFHTSIHISDKNSRDIEGSFKLKYTGYQAWNSAIGLSYYTKEKEERQRLVSQMAAMGSNKFTLDNYEVKTEEGGNKDMAVNGNFTIGNYVNKVGKDYIINMNMRRQFENDYIDTAGRKAAWYHSFKSVEKEVVTLDIPEGCKVTYLPKGAQGRLNDMWSYTIAYKSDGKKITLTKEYTINTLKVPASQFVENNKAIKELEKQYKEAVVLTAK